MTQLLRNVPNAASRRALERLSRSELSHLQLQKLNRLLPELQRQNSFYQRKFQGLPTALDRLDQWQQFPLTNKDELLPLPGSTGHAANLTYEQDRYVRYHRTSGTHGKPLVVLDTADDWQWWIDIWQFVLDAAHVTSADRVAMAFSFGPFIGFWTANDALVSRGALVIPCGGMSSLARLDLILSERATVVCCTPSYALHLASVASEHGLNLPDSSVRQLIVAGEPGGSLPAMRGRIEAAWGARMTDHAGATEVGPWGYAAADGRGLHLVESEFIAEFLRPVDHRPAAPGDLAELVISSLGRWGAPVLRYRTGDLVRPRFHSADENHFVYLEGGVLGRVDDMMIVRGVNVYPSAVEQILHDLPMIREYRMIVSRCGEMDELTIEIEADSPSSTVELEVATVIELRLGLHAEIQSVPMGTLPRFEHKGQRFIDQRK